MLLILLLSLLAEAPRVQGFSTFTPNCTLPTDKVNVMAATNLRSTLDILWSCLFTAFACTWSVLHLNVPEQRQGRDPGIKGDLKWKWKRFSKTMKWMMITLLAPEYTFYLACNQLVTAFKIRKLMRDFAEADGVEFTLTHAFFVNMGGFAIELAPEEQMVESTIKDVPKAVGNTNDFGANIRGRYEDETQVDNHKITSLHEPGTEDIGLIIRDISVCDNIETARSQIHRRLLHLHGGAVLELRRRQKLTRLPLIRKEHIDDQSKSDIFAKVITATQIFSFVVQLLSRQSRHLTISALELGVTALCCVAVVMYCLLLYKPKDVSTPHILIDRVALSPNDTAEILELNRQYSGNFRGDNLSDYYIIKNDGYEEPSAVDESYVIAAGGAIFGAIHCAGWNYPFPTTVETLLWRIASVFCTASLPVISMALSLERYLSKFSNRVWAPSLLLFLPLYTLARLFLIVEMFRSLFFLPPEAFIKTWASNIPQFG